MLKSATWIAALYFVALTVLTACSTRAPAVPEGRAAPSPAVAPVVSETRETEWEKTLAAARKEGSVIMAAAFGMAPARDAMIQGLRNKYGIRLDMVTGTGVELTAKILAERRAGIYGWDILAGGASTAQDALIPQGALRPIRPFLTLPEVTDPRLWFDIHGKGDLPVWDKDGYLFLTVGEPTSSININTNLVKPQEIRRNRDLMNPKWKGKIIMDLTTRPGVGPTWLHWVSNVLGYGQDWFRDFLKQQQPVVNSDHRQRTEWVSQGKMLLGVGASVALTQPMRADGAPIMMISDMDEKLYVHGGGGYFGVFNNSPHPNAQRVALNYFLSKEGQTIITRALVTVSLRLDVPTDHVEPGLLPKVGKVHIQNEEDEKGKNEVQVWSARILKEMGY